MQQNPRLGGHGFGRGVHGIKACPELVEGSAGPVTGLGGGTLAWMGGCRKGWRFEVIQRAIVFPT